MKNNIKSPIEFDIIDEEMLIKEREKAEKIALKAAEKSKKLALKAAKKEAEKTEKGKKKALKAAEKAAEKAKKLENRLINKGKKLAREEGHKYEIREESITNLIVLGRQLDGENPTNQNYSIDVICEKYIELFGRINPYNLKPPANDEYDLKGAIRGIIYESSPSSMQHWFRYGKKKLARQVSPWIFANKNLAISNNKFNWRKTDKEMATDKKKNIGVWFLIKDANLEFCWDEDKYGPKPTQEQLDEAEESGERVEGVRKSNNSI
jgi:hypothetical protein